MEGGSLDARREVLHAATPWIEPKIFWAMKPSGADHPQARIALTQANHAHLRE
ncbi:hypothetical protein Mesil_1699 [Allomeiothermus silvanus DSM 9946]|uniref:Uncharacterized protein n=1 Tax=Allomeiothermus silvanus (strain ATCC 700542 / DSM 9946 / NBRC 106475 / NCIMB 13440 / VI-R2) TaxID=526227 RepID=D7BFM9_ALLS1|nr:hypothetical protein [Allomeiothermus silvanus]ADH63582.1 hypothetical protein Mesil_1699 [Allomeiothermus silvanus DSM 9946]